MINLDYCKTSLSEEKSEEKEYIENRIQKQIEYYDQKSEKNKKTYRFLMILNVIAGALIPIFSLVSDTSLPIQIIISALGASISIIISVVSLYNFRELWVQYRTNCEMLKSTLYLYNTKSGIFHNNSESENFHLLVDTCEKYIVKEFTSWQILQSRSYSNKS